MRTCYDCKVEKPLDEFKRNAGKPQGRSYQCKLCAVAERRVYRTTPKGKLSMRRDNVSRYGISLSDFDRMKSEQNGACAICKEVTEETLHIDHCHESNNVRGLLCTACNKGLGCFKDNPEALAEAIRYLAKHGG